VDIADLKCCAAGFRFDGGTAFLAENVTRAGFALTAPVALATRTWPPLFRGKRRPAMFAEIDISSAP